MNRIFNTRLKTAISTFVLLIFVALPPSGNAATQKQVPMEIEVVTTIPVETSLENSGIKHAARTWVKMINSASNSIDLAHFYLSTKESEPLEPIIEAIIKAADRGVRIRFLVGTPINDEMAERTEEVLNRFKNNKNIDVITFNWKPLTGGILHAKYFIVDNREAFLGSQNFDWRALKHIHETGLRIKNDRFISALSAVFEVDWQYNKGDKQVYKKMATRKVHVPGNQLFLLSSPESFNPPGIKSALKTLLRLIDSSKKRITIQLLDYRVDIYGSKEKFSVIDDALRRAASRGVQVKLMVSNWNLRKPGVDALKYLVRVPNIEVKYIRIPRYSKGFIPYARVIHSKVMRVDDNISWVGTSNWGKRYFYDSRNIEIVTYIPKVAAKLDELFKDLWTSKYAFPIQPNKIYTPPRIR